MSDKWEATAKQIWERFVKAERRAIAKCWQDQKRNSEVCRLWTKYTNLLRAQQQEKEVMGAIAEKSLQQIASMAHAERQEKEQLSDVARKAAKAYGHDPSSRDGEIFREGFVAAWTPEFVKSMLDEWGRFTDLPPSEYERIADEHNAARQQEKEQ